MSFIFWNFQKTTDAVRMKLFDLSHDLFWNMLILPLLTFACSIFVLPKLVFPLTKIDHILIYIMYIIYIYIYIYLYSLYNSRMKLIKSAQWEEQRYHNWVRWISVIICYFKFYVKTIFRHIQCLFILSQWLNGSMTLYKRLKRWEIFILFKKNVFLFLIYTLRRHCDFFFLNINSRTRTCDVTVPLSIP